MTSQQGWDQAQYRPGGTGPGGGWPGGGGPMGPPRNGLGIAALTLALIGVVLFWTMLVGIVLGALAVIFGIVGYSRAKRGQATNGTMAIVGAVIGGLALVGSGIFLFLVVSLLGSGDFTELDECMQRATGSSTEEQKCVDDFFDSFGQ
jgi:hypothetical protein